MVQIAPLFATLFTIPFLVAQAAPTIENLIHAQSHSGLNDYVPMQKLGQDGLPIDHRLSAAAVSMPFRPIMVVPLPSSAAPIRSAKLSPNEDLHSSKDSNMFVGMDDQGRLQTVRMPATLGPKPTHAPVAPAVKNRKNFVGMEDDGQVQTLALPMTTRVM